MNKFVRVTISVLLLSFAIESATPVFADAASTDKERQYIELQQQADSLMKQEKYRDAEAKYRELVAFTRQYPGPRRLYLSTSLQGLAMSLNKLDRGHDSLNVTMEANRIIAEELKNVGMASTGNQLESITKSAAATIRATESQVGSMNGSMKRARDASIKASMRTVQIAAESYASDRNSYPVKLDGVFMSYFPGGDYSSKPGKPPLNILTKKPEWPVLVVAGVAVKPSPGLVVYTYSKDRKQYSIYGFDQDLKYLVDPTTNKTLVLKGHL